MDVSGGSGQPRSGSEEPAEHHAGRAAPAADPARPGPAPSGDTHPEPARREPGGPAPAGPAPEGAPAGDAVPTGAEDRRGEPCGNGEPSGTDRPDPADGPAGGRPGAGAPSAGGGPGDRTSASSPHATAGPERERGENTGHGAEGTAGTDGSSGDGPGGDTARPAPAVAPGPPPQRPPEPGGGLLMGRPFGVPVYVAPSWFLVAALITWVFGGQLDRVLPELGAARYLVSLFFAVAFYASVLVHELAHTLAALRFKLPVRRIQLQFFGGVSEIEKEAETPGREFVLAFVGPLLSLVLAGVFYLALQPVEPGTVPGVLLAGLMISNLIVAAFNLLPGLPLDGGRMLRAVVWKITGKPMTGTVAAAWVGRALAVSVLIGLPLLTQSGALGSDAVDNVGMDTVMDALLAAILAAIIWTGAGNSLRMARLREHLPDLRARTLTRRAVPVESDTPLSEALRRANAAGARALVVVDAEGSPLSIVREAAIVGVPEHRRPWVAVSGLAQDLTDGMRVSAELAGEELLDVLRATPATEYLVVEETGAIYGVLSAADVERAFVKAMARPSA
ncbi:peptidase [Streptomyces cyaneogriseus subsp. noncyanogenus]|uniref:Peptidase n=1 Tax=Streptomyces cyaneogriseus subsp. noncyanogenus TaxID=477245 RepID=A0A0C5FXT7_9ACTN|nr:site-2 protease family protein [Streptomyces cyaneogriseus]AJP01250.1 peptidase [Streptomyces cyaneogriseus subsp. noncyanogenus]